MKDTLDPKQPIENWRFEVVIDELDLSLHMTALGKGHNLKEGLASIGRALLNAKEYIENRDFILTADGSLVAEKPSVLLENHILEIDLTLGSTISSLARFKRELEARKENGEFFDWLVTGRLKGNPRYIDYLILDKDGHFYLYNRRKSCDSACIKLERNAV